MNFIRYQWYLFSSLVKFEYVKIILFYLHNLFLLIKIYSLIFLNFILTLLNLTKFFEKKASEIMTKNPTLANKNMLVGEAINLMNTKKITSLFICDKKKPLGIVHIHDLLRLTS